MEASQALFFQKEYDNPLLNSPGKTVEDIQKAVSTMKHTQQLLQKKGIRLLMVVIPSKTHLYLPEYRDIADEQRSIFLLEKEMEKNNIPFIPLAEIILKKRFTQGKEFYFKDDTHWNTATNELITQQVSEFIRKDNINQERSKRNVIR